MQAIKNNEAIAATDASVKNEKMEWLWLIEDDYRINRSKNKIVSNQWMQNVAIATEAITILDLVDTVINNIGGNESGKIAVCNDCKIVNDMLTLDRIKAS